MAKAEFPSNSNSRDERINQIEKLKAVPEPSEVEEKAEESAEKQSFEGKVFTKRQKLGPRLKRMFVDDGQSYAEVLMETIIVPRLKDIGMGIINQILSNVHRGVEDAFFPNGSGSRDVRSSRGGPINYNDLHRSSTTIHRGGSVVTPFSRPQSRQSNRIEDVLFEYRSDAQKALTFVESQIEEYGHCTLGDYYDYVDPSLIQSTDDKWGWTDVRRSHISEVGPNEFRLVLPEPRPIHRR